MGVYMKNKKNSKGGKGDIIGKKKFHFLLIDDNPNDRELAIRHLKKSFSELDVDEVLNKEQFEEALNAGDFDLVITDYQLRWTNGLKILKAVKGKYPDTPVIMFTGTGTEKVAVEAMKEGLDDYIVKSKKHFKRLSGSSLSILKRNIEKRERKKALKESENKFKTIFENTGTGIVVVDENHIIKMVNEKFTKIVGFDKDELIGKDCIELITKDYKEDFVNYINKQKIDSDKIPKSYRMEIANKFGGVKDLLVNISIIPNMGNSIMSAMDITKSREMMEALRESEELFRIIFDNVPVGIAILDDDRNFLHVNDELIRILDFTEEELLDKKLEQITTEENRDDFLQSISNVDEKQNGYINGESVFIGGIEDEGKSEWSISFVENPSGESDRLVFTLFN